MAIYPLVPVLHYSDATGNQALTIQQLLRKWRIPSEISAAEGDAHLIGECQGYRTYSGNPNNAMIFHYGKWGNR